MTSSLVGSEMCIRDRFFGSRVGCIAGVLLPKDEMQVSTTGVTREDLSPVSYTHLTLPTICSV
eukprot:5271719-Prorocentrum_lima.AAC.1